MGRERDGLAERERQDEEKVANIQARQARAATSFEAVTVAQEVEEEETPKPKSRSKKNST